MRLVTIRDGGFGAVLEADGRDRFVALPGTVEQTLADEAALESARDLIARTDTLTLPVLDPAALLAPVRPGKIVCIGYNYRHHVPDGADPTADDPEFPDVFLKSPNVLIGPADSVRLPAVPADVDYEGEIALVIGRRAKNVLLASAMDHVAGYTLFNDVTARDWQRRTSQWALGKSFDTFGPLGPWIVTSDAVADPHDLLVEVVRDGVVTVSQSTSTMVFSMAFLVHHLSQVMTLDPGDIISTGSPQKLATVQDAHTPLAPGDAVTIRVAGIGELTTSFSD
ncbi:MAG: fumarylacetoacetate hydrolase family protein [Pseudolysinimonas sp.]|uniref:fumarylacetoacetate hydrolase family protein n=1 Tax=Pseudolysinimonas sp. TaxID=2680009 RepID=UPI003264C40F